MDFFQHLGNYATLMKATFARPEKGKVYWMLIIEEIEKIGLSSIGIVSIVAAFFGAVISIQTANNMDNPLLPQMLRIWNSRFDYFGVFVNNNVFDIIGESWLKHCIGNREYESNTTN